MFTDRAKSKGGEKKDQEAIKGKKNNPEERPRRCNGWDHIRNGGYKRIHLGCCSFGKVDGGVLNV